MKGDMFMFGKVKKMGLLIILFFLVGCGIQYNNDVNTVVYNLNIGKTFKENIIFTVDSNSNFLDKMIDEENENEDFIYRLFKTDINNFPIADNERFMYKKKINKGDNKLEGILKYEYLESEYDYSKFITECFENYDMITNESFFEASISGEFYCWNDFDIDINVTSDFTSIDSNGENINNKYIWNINKDNYQDVDIYYKVYRNYDSQFKKHKASFFSINFFDNIKYIFSIIVIIIMFFGLFRMYKKSKND